MLEIESISARVTADASQYFEVVGQQVPATTTGAVNHIISSAQKLHITTANLTRQESQYIANAASQIVTSSGDAQRALTAMIGPMEGIASVASSTSTALIVLQTTALTAASAAASVAPAASSASTGLIIFQGAALAAATAATIASTGLIRLRSSAYDAAGELIRVASAAKDTALAVYVANVVNGGASLDAMMGRLRGSTLSLARSSQQLLIGTASAAKSAAASTATASASMFRNLFSSLSRMGSSFFGSISGLAASAAAGIMQFAGAVSGVAEAGIRMLPYGGQILGIITQMGLSAPVAAAAIVGLGAALSGLVVGNWAVNLAADMQTATTGFRVMLGDADKAKELVSQIRQLAKTTPLETKPLMDTAGSLLAANVAAEDIVGTLRMLGDLARGDQVRLDFLAKAYTDVRNKGKLAGQEIRQFSENSVGLLGALAMQKFGNETDISKAKIQKMSEQGEISFYDVKLALESLTGEGGRFHNAMAEAAKDLNGRMAFMRDTWQEFGVELGEVLMPFKVQAVEALTEIGEHSSHILAKLKGEWAWMTGGVEGFFTTAIPGLKTVSDTANDAEAAIAKALIPPKNGDAWIAYFGDPLDILMVIPDTIGTVTGMLDANDKVLQQHTTGVLWRWLYGDPAHEAALLQHSSVYLKIMDDAKKEGEKAAAAQAEAERKKSEAIDAASEKAQDALDAAEKKLDSGIEKSRQAITALNNGWSDEVAKDMALLADIVAGGVDPNSERYKELEQLLAQERELTAATKEQAEAEKELGKETEAVYKLRAKAEQDLQAAQNGWSTEMARDMAKLREIQEKFKLAEDDPRLQELAQIMAQEREITENAKQQAKLKKEAESEAEKIQNKAESDAKALTEKYMTPLQKLQTETAKLHNLRAANLIDDKTLKAALADLKEIERQQHKIDLGLSEQQLAYMRANSVGDPKIPTMGWTPGSIWKGGKGDPTQITLQPYDPSYGTPSEQGTLQGLQNKHKLPGANIGVAALTPDQSIAAGAQQGASGSGMVAGKAQGPQTITTPSGPTSDPSVEILRQIALDIRQSLNLQRTEANTPEVVEIVEIGA